MGENRSLDDFLTPTSDGTADEGSGEDASNEASSEEPTDEGGDEASAAEASAVEPTADEPTGERNDADEGDGGSVETTDTSEDVTVDTDATGDADTPRTTYRWSPDSDDCPACGASVERRWRDGDRFVCADCKEW